MLCFGLFLFLVSGLVRPSSGDPFGWHRVRRPFTPKPITRQVVVPTTRRPATQIPKENCSLIVDKVPKLSRYYHSFRKFRRPLCVRLNESQLLQMLKDVGGYNPRYVGINREAVCSFTDLSQNAKLLPRNSSRPVRPKRQKRMVSLPGTTLKRGCWGRGSFLDGTPLLRMCTECAATTHLPANIFPPFVNEVLCGDTDGYCHLRRGRCIQKFLVFTFLKNTEEFERDDDLSEDLGMDVYKAKYDTINYQIRSCCDCGNFAFPVG